MQYLEIYICFISIKLLVMVFPQMFKINPFLQNSITQHINTTFLSICLLKDLQTASKFSQLFIMNDCIQVLFPYDDFNSPGKISRRRILRLNGSSSFNSLRILHTDFQNGNICVHFNQQCRSSLFPPQPHRHLLLLDFFDACRCFQDKLKMQGCFNLHFSSDQQC